MRTSNVPTMHANQTSEEWLRFNHGVTSLGELRALVDRSDGYEDDAKVVFSLGSSLVVGRGGDPRVKGIGVRAQA